MPLSAINYDTMSYRRVVYATILLCDMSVCLAVCLPVYGMHGSTRLGLFISSNFFFETNGVVKLWHGHHRGVKYWQSINIWDSLCARTLHH